MAESLSNVFDKNRFRHYFNFKRGNLNPEYHHRLTAGRQWKNATVLLISRIIVLRRLPCGAALPEKTSAKRQNFETKPKKSLTVLQIANSIPSCYYCNKVILDFAETLTFARVYKKELQWLLLS